jgi:predicted nucleic acid-binding protein
VRFFFLDASALAKRYAPEVGSPVIDHLFASVPFDRLSVLSVGIAELVSLLVRKKNSGHLSAAALAQALVDVGIEVVLPTGLRKVEANLRRVLDALRLVEVHSINGTDAILLRCALEEAADHRSRGDDLVVVASDQRLLRAAQAEGLVTFNPETQDQAALAALLVP